jgi:hypothetical protein
VRSRFASITSINFENTLGISGPISAAEGDFFALMMGLTPENLRRTIIIHHGKGKNSETRQRLQSRF